MGYSTDFEGEFSLDRPLTPEQRAYLLAFSRTRRVRRHPAIAATMDDPARTAVGLPIGPEASYFTGGLGFRGQDNDPSVLDPNEPPDEQPGLWCKWAPNEEGDAIVWDEREKFYAYIPWLQYLLVHFLGPWGYTVNGEVSWQGEYPKDAGMIIVENNVVYTRKYEHALGPRVAYTQEEDES